MSRHQNLPSSISSTSTTASNLTSVPATPMAPTPCSRTTDSNPAPGLPPSSTSHTCMDCTNEWVINLSKTPSPKNNYPYYKKDPTLLSPPNTPIEAYITATKQASSKLPVQEANELRSDVNKILKQQQQHHNNQCNLNPSQCRALTQLKQDNSRVVLTVEKGVAMVIMDQKDYTNKALTLLQDTNTYKVLPRDPTSQLKNKLISLLKDIKQTGGLTTKYKQLYPTSAIPPNSMACPKLPKQVHPSAHCFQ